MDLTTFAKNDSEAEERATRFEKVDPFTSAPYSLLSSVEILDYAKVTGMLFPFYEEHLKSASYEVHIGGDVIWWDGDGEMQTKRVRRGSKLVLKANSIVFAQVEPTFRLPNYIAIRFNLRITHVHRGLLLGTGPLVDPGFHGQLLIPLHNLTSEDYDIDTNDALIWVEFTKTTYGYAPPPGDALAITDREKAFRGFPPHKRHMLPEQYLKKANDGKPIRSSIPETMLQSKNASELAKIEAKSAQGEAKKAQFAAENADASVTTIKTYIGIGALVAVITLAVSLYQIGQQFGSMIQNAQSLISTLSNDSKAITEKVTSLAAENKALTEKTMELQTHNDDLAKRNEELSRRIDELGSQFQRQPKAAPPAPNSRP